MEERPKQWDSEETGSVGTASDTAVLPKRRAGREVLWRHQLWEWMLLDSRMSSSHRSLQKHLMILSSLKTRKQSFENGGRGSKLQRTWGEVSAGCMLCLSSRGRYNLSPNYLLKFAVWLFALTLLCLAITTAKVIIHLNVKITYALWI